MHKQRTFTELKRIGDEAFAEAQAAIDRARDIVHECRQLNADLRLTIAEFNDGKMHSRNAVKTSRWSVL